MDDQMKVQFTGDASSLENAAKKSAAALDLVSNATTKVSQSLGQASATLAQNAAKMGGSLDHVANRSSTARFAVQNLSNVVRDIPFGINNPAIFSTALDHVVASMTMLKQEAASMSAATGQSISGFGLLKQSIAGGGGLLIAFNLASLAATYLIPLLAGLGSGAESQAEKLKALKKELDDYVEGLNDVDKASVKGKQSAAQQLVSLQTLYAATQDANIPLAQRKKLVDQLQEQYPKYFANISDEIILAGGAKKAYNELSSAILASAKARAEQDVLVDIQKQLLAVDQQIAGNAANRLKTEQQINKVRQSPVTTTSATGEERLTANGAKLNKITDQYNSLVSDGNDLQKQRNDLLSRAKVLSDAVTKTVEQNPDALLDPTGKPKAKKEDKTAFLFDFLPFDPNGKLKPEQKGELLKAIDTFQKEFGTIIQGAIFTGSEDQRIAQAKKLDLNIKAGNIKFDTASFKEAFNKLNKDSDIIPQDTLEGISKEVVDQFIRGFQNESERAKGVNLFGDLTRTFEDQVDLFKTQVKQVGGTLPKLFEGKNIFGNKQLFSLDELFDRSKIDDKSAREALRGAFEGIGSTIDKGAKLINDAIASIQVEGLASIGEGIAAALTGGNIGDVFKSFEQTLGGAIQSLGKQMIALFVTADALKKALGKAFLNPEIGIAAGVGLVIVGAAIKKLAGGGIKGFAKGGWVPGSGSGDTVPAMLTPGEYVLTKQEAPFWVSLKNMLGGGMKMPRITNGVMGFASGGLVPARAIDRNANFSSGSFVDVNVNMQGQVRGKDIVFVHAQTIKSQRRAT
jgi:hypothetical protein